MWRVLHKIAVALWVLLLATVATEFVSFLNASNPREIELLWKLSTESDVAGYTIYYDTSSRYQGGFSGYRYREDVPEGDFQVENTTGTFKLASLDPTLTYWVSLTAYDHSGNESDYSNELTVVPVGDSTTQPGGAGAGGCQISPSQASVSLGSVASWSLSLGLPLFWMNLVRSRLRRYL